MVLVLKPDAKDTITELAKPAARETADAIAASIPAFVPVVRGVMRRSYQLVVTEADEGYHVNVDSPFWHWLEYGTQFNPAYRPVETACRALGLRYEAH